MKRFLAFLAMMAFLFLLSMGVNLAQDEPLRFSRPEIESMLYLFNETSIKGVDIDAFASLSQKLKQGVKQAEVYADTSQTVPLNVTAQEAQICLDIINNSTFQARYVDLILGMKKKLQKFAPSPH